MRPYYLAGNWKLQKTASETSAFIAELAQAVKGAKHRVLVAPSFVALDAAVKAAKGTNIAVGAQNVSAFENGAHTGEVSVSMLKDIGVNTVIVGHSERRTIYKEDDALINQKVKLALQHDFEVILCVGETKDERQAGKAESVTLGQIRAGLKDVSDISKVVIAYEPVWAIGTGLTATPADAQAMHKAIRDDIAKLYNAKVSESTIIQYGGSVKPDNVKELMSQPDIDGALVGGASLKVQDFTAIVKFDI